MSAPGNSPPASPHIQSSSSRPAPSTAPGLHRETNLNFSPEIHQKRFRPPLTSSLTITHSLLTASRQGFRWRITWRDSPEVIHKAKVICQEWSPCIRDVPITATPVYIRVHVAVYVILYLIDYRNLIKTKKRPCSCFNTDRFGREAEPNLPYGEELK